MPDFTIIDDLGPGPTYEDLRRCRQLLDQQDEELRIWLTPRHERHVYNKIKELEERPMNKDWDFDQREASYAALKRREPLEFEDVAHDGNTHAAEGVIDLDEQRAQRAGAELRIRVLMRRLRKMNREYEEIFAELRDLGVDV